MRYTYTLISPIENKKLDVCTRFEEVEQMYKPSYVVEVFDNVSHTITMYLNNAEDMLGWRTKLERDSTWVQPQFTTTGCIGVSTGVINKTDSTVSVSSVSTTASPYFVASNPKAANAKNVAGNSKLSTAAVPPVAIFALGAAMQNGADKYGRFNWRDTEVTASVFYNAMMRHLQQWWSGENYADDSKVHHLAHLMAGAAILLDAELHNFIDDRDTHKVALDSMKGVIKE